MKTSPPKETTLTMAYTRGSEVMNTGELIDQYPVYELDRGHRVDDGVKLGKWSGRSGHHGERKALEMPGVGDEIIVTMNNIGRAMVIGYFIEGGFIGVLAKPYKRPGYFNHQQWANSQKVGCHVFGVEMRMPD